MPFAEANIDTTKFEIESWVYANTLNGYRYNYDSANGGDTGDRVDQCLYWIDDPDCISYPSVLLLKNDDTLDSMRVPRCFTMRDEDTVLINVQ